MSTSPTPADFLRNAERILSGANDLMAQLKALVTDEARYPELVEPTTLTGNRVDVRLDGWRPGTDGRAYPVLFTRAYGSVNGVALPGGSEVGTSLAVGIARSDDTELRCYVYGGSYSDLSDSARSKVTKAALEYVLAQGITASFVREWGLSTCAYSEARSLVHRLDHADYMARSGVAHAIDAAKQALGA